MYNALHRKQLGHRRHCGAFTLIELMAVIVIIAILLALVLAMGEYAKRWAQDGRARAEIEQLHNVLQEYWMKNCRYPASLASIVSNLSGGFTVVSNAPMDPWMRPYIYSNTLPNIYVLYSLGHDPTNNADNIQSRK